MKNIYSKEYQKFLKQKKQKSFVIVVIQISILILFVGLWELLARLNVIDSFILSCPSNIVKVVIDLAKDGTLFMHMWTTLYEALVGFLIATVVGTLVAILLWWNDTIYKVLDPYIVVLNSLPKIALGPVLIIWIGVGTKAIVAMDVLIMVVITTLSMLNAFRACDKNQIMLLKSMGASKFQILTKLILPNSLCDFISVLKINVGLTWVGTIMGEYLVSKAGLGYLIVYGGQIFNLDLVMASTVLLCVMAGLMYMVVAAIEKRFNKKLKK